MLNFLNFLIPGFLKDFIREQIQTAIKLEERRLKNEIFLQRFGFSYDDYEIMIQYDRLFLKPINLEEISIYLKEEK